MNNNIKQLTERKLDPKEEHSNKEIELEKNISKLQTELKLKETIIKSLQEQITKNELQNKTLLNSKEELNKKYNSTLSEIQVYKNEIASLKEQCNKAEQLIIEQLKTLIEQNTKLQNNLLHSTSKIVEQPSTTNQQKKNESAFNKHKKSKSRVEFRIKHNEFPSNTHSVLDDTKTDVTFEKMYHVLSSQGYQGNEINSLLNIISQCKSVIDLNKEKFGSILEQNKEMLQKYENLTGSHSANNVNQGCQNKKQK